MRQVKPCHWRRRCPCHKGTSDTSLSVWDTGQGKAGLHGFGGCDVGAILARVGLSVADLHDGSWTTRPLRLSNGSAPDTELQRLVSATDGAGSHAAHRRRRVSSKKFEIRAEGGEVVAVHVRTTFNDGTKDIVWERPDGASGLNGTKASALPLYGIHELGEPTEVVVTEGEPARDALAGLGIPAVGTVTGADGVPDDAALRP